MDALLNFSRQYLPERRGAKTMDAPLVLTSVLYPTEVDDQVHGIDVVWKYPLELYEGALEMKNPWDIRDHKGNKVEQLADRLGKPSQYEDFGFTHHVDNFNRGTLCSAYSSNNGRKIVWPNGHCSKSSSSKYG
jgi:DNA polymerase II large subunit